MPLIEPHSLSDLQIAEGINAKVITGETMTVCHVTIEAGTLLPEHSHYHEQILNLISGEMMVTVDGEEYRMKAGDVMQLPPNVIHSGRAVTECRVIDAFHPVRKEFIGDDFAGYE